MTQINTEATTEAAVLLEAGAALVRPIVTHSTLERDYLVHPDDMTVKDVTVERPAPMALKTLVTVASVVSLVDYVRLFSPAEAPTAVAFADITHAVGDGQDVIGVTLDYHRRADLPSWNRHKVCLPLKTTERWNDWAGINGKAMPQLEFAQFLEDHIADIGSPNGGVLHELVLRFEAMKAVSFKSHHRLEDGSVQFHYTEDVQGSAQDKSMKIPTTVILMLSPFAGLPLKQVEAKVRYTVAPSGLKLSLHMPGLEDILDQARQEVAALAQTALGTHVRAFIYGDYR